MCPGIGHLLGVGRRGRQPRRATSGTREPHGHLLVPRRIGVDAVVLAHDGRSVPGVHSDRRDREVVEVVYCDRLRAREMMRPCPYTCRVPRNDPDRKMARRREAATAMEAIAFLGQAMHKASRYPDWRVLDRLVGIKRDILRIHDRAKGEGEGHVGSRKKHRGRSQHLAKENWPVHVLYLDESGQSVHSPDQPVFVLCGVALDEPSSAQFAERSSELKKQYGADPNATLHATDLERGAGGFEFLSDPSISTLFWKDLTNAVEETPFELFAAVVRKTRLTGSDDDGELGNLPGDVYEIALTLVLERLVGALYDRGCTKGRLVFESIGGREDALHQRALADLLLHGSEFVADGCFRGCIEPGCSFAVKGGSSPLELADLCARWIMTFFRDGQPHDHRFWSIVAPKIYASGLEKGKFGLKVFPDSDIREEVLALRRAIMELKEARH